MGRFPAPQFAVQEENASNMTTPLDASIQAVAKTKSSSVVPHVNPLADRLCHVWPSANHQHVNALLVSYETKEDVS
ncbi:hypothetical protein OESDEN_12272, partial [Oesophagostomum dentatum]